MIQDKEEVLRLVKQNGMNLRLAFWNLREDKELVLEAVKNNPHAIQFASDELQKDEGLLSYVTKNDDYYLSIVDDSGYKFSIPNSDGSKESYIYYMQLRERSPTTFENAIRFN